MGNRRPYRCRSSYRPHHSTDQFVQQDGQLQAEKNKSLTQFVSRFHGLASQHLIHAGLSSSSQVGEFLAITLLGNANLGETTHQGAKIQLINAAESRIEKEKKALYVLTDQDSEDLDKVKDKITSGLSSFEVSEGDDVLSVTEKFQQVSSAIAEALEILTGIITRSKRNS